MNRGARERGDAAPFGMPESVLGRDRALECSLLPGACGGACGPGLLAFWMFGGVRRPKTYEGKGMGMFGQECRGMAGRHVPEGVTARTPKAVETLGTTHCARAYTSS